MPKRGTAKLCGQRFGYLNVYRYMGSSTYECICSLCGKHIKRTTRQLTLGKTLMCEDCKKLAIENGGRPIMRFVPGQTLK